MPLGVGVSFEAVAKEVRDTSLAEPMIHCNT